MKYVIISLCFSIAYCGFGAINFYQAKNIVPTFKRLAIYNLSILPIIFLLNLLVTFTFNKGYKSVGEMLPVTIIYVAVGVFSYVIVNYIFFKEIPRLNQFIAILLVFIALILCNIKNK